MIDTHKMVQSLEKAGFSAEQAETLTAAFRETQTQSLADLVTKQDLEIGLAPVKTDIAVLKSEVAVLKWLTAFVLAAQLAALFRAFL